jgi:hypothetical protein
MLFTYSYPQNHPLEHLNDYLFQFLTAIRTVPSNSQFRINNFFHQNLLAIINRSPTLKKKFHDFFSAYKILDQNQKNAFYELVLKSQNIQDFFTDINIVCSDTMSTQITLLIGNDSFNSLVGHLFKVTLKSLDIKDHYNTIYNAMPYKVCPFCGVEKLHKSFQEDYDHLAAKRHYPLVAIHMKNLAPMCHTCNSKNKGEKDVLHNPDLTRKLFIYPYTQSIDLTIDFSNCIIPQTNENNANGNWEINLNPDNAITQNWDGIFGIKKRFKEDYLESNFEEWVDDFLDGLKLSNIALQSSQDVIDQLLSWSQILEERKFHNVNFIKSPLFRFLSNCGINSFYLSIITRYNQKLVA